MKPSFSIKLSIHHCPSFSTPSAHFTSPNRPSPCSTALPCPLPCPALHEDAVHLSGLADLQCLLLLGVVRVDEAQGPAVDGVRWNDDAEGLLIPGAEGASKCEM